MKLHNSGLMTISVYIMIIRYMDGAISALKIIHNIKMDIFFRAH